MKRNIGWVGRLGTVGIKNSHLSQVTDVGHVAVGFYFRFRARHSHYLPALRTVALCAVLRHVQLPLALHGLWFRWDLAIVQRNNAQLFDTAWSNLENNNVPSTLGFYRTVPWTENQSHSCSVFLVDNLAVIEALISDLTPCQILGALVLRPIKHSDMLFANNSYQIIHRSQIDTEVS